MLLAPARPHPKPSQLESPSDLSTQREDDPESGLMHYRARSYDPRVGRMVQRDSYGTERAIKAPYFYAAHRPADRRDPTGLFEEDTHQWLTYYLAKMAGLQHDRARIVAVSDQYTDENPRTEPVQWERRVAETFLSHKVIGVPFVLLYGILVAPVEGFGPLIEGSSVYSSGAVPLIVNRIHFPAGSPNNEVEAGSSHAYRIVDASLALAGRSRTRGGGPELPESMFRFQTGRPPHHPDLPYYLMGIGLHSLQDSFSHQGYSGTSGHAKNRSVDNPFTNQAAARNAAQHSFDALAAMGGGGRGWMAASRFVDQFIRTENKEERIALVRWEASVGNLQAFDAGERRLHDRAVDYLQRNWKFMR